MPHASCVMDASRVMDACEASGERNESTAHQDMCLPIRTSAHVSTDFTLLYPALSFL